MREGLERAQVLPVGALTLQALAGFDRPWGGTLSPFAQLEFGIHPLGPLSAFAFGRTDGFGLTGGIGARLSF